MGEKQILVEEPESISIYSYWYKQITQGFVSPVRNLGKTYVNFSMKVVEKSLKISE